MKKLFVFTSLFVFISSSLFAQEEIEKDKIRIGVSVGAVISSVGGDDAENVDSRTGFRFGGILDVPLSEKLALQPVVGFSIQGWKDEGFEIKNNYVVIEVKADYELVDGLSVQAGPLLGINIFNSFDGYEDITGFASTNIGALVGLQYELPFGLFFNAQYDRGFTNLVDGFDIKNRNISISAGYFF